MLMDDTQSLQVIRRPLIAYVSREDHSLPECYEHWDLPEVYIPVIINNRQAIVPYSPKPPPLSARESVSAFKPAQRSFWRRNRVLIALFAVLLVCGGVAGIASGVIISRRNGRTESAAGGGGGSQDGVSR